MSIVSVLEQCSFSVSDVLVKSIQNKTRRFYAPCFLGAVRSAAAAVVVASAAIVTAASAAVEAVAVAESAESDDDYEDYYPPVTVEAVAVHKEVLLCNDLSQPCGFPLSKAYSIIYAAVKNVLQREGFLPKVQAVLPL